MASRPPFLIGPTSVMPGTRSIVNLPVSVLSDHTPVNLSVEVIHGRKDGPAVFLSAAIHGDEIIGVEILRRLLRDPALDRISGTLLVVPIVNAFGFLSRSRYMPDRRDLNRSFPGSPRGSLAARLAHLFMTEVVARCSVGIDLHSAAIHRTNLPQIRVTARRPESLRLARTFDAPVVLTSPERPGSLRAEARERGVEVLLFEAGEGLRFDEAAVKCGLRGILRVLREKGIVMGRNGTAGAPLICESSSWLRAPAGGILRSFRADGETVEPGDVLATVSGPFGETEAELRAPFAGVIIGRALLPVVNEGDAVYHLARLAAGGTTAATEAPVFDEDEII